MAANPKCLTPYRRNVRLAAVVILTTLCVAPVAAATSVTGELRLSDELTLPSGTLLNAPLHALFARDIPGTVTVTGTLDSAHVVMIEKRYASAALGPLRPSATLQDSRPEWDLTRVTFDASSGLPGWIGLEAGSGSIEERSDASVRISIVEDEIIGNVELAGAENDPEQAYFHSQMKGPGLSRTANSWSFTGGGYIKLFGPTVKLTARENTTTIQTGEFQDPSMPGQIVRRWIQLNFPNGTIRAICPTEVYSTRLDASWDGEARFAQAMGELEGDDRTWVANGTESISGKLDARLEPISQGIFRLELRGDLSQTSMTARAPSSPIATSGTKFLLGLLLAAVFAGGAGVLAVRARRKRDSTPLIDTEAYARLADDAADAEDYDRATRFAALARRQSPTSRRLALDHAYYESKLGRDDEALRILSQRVLADDPDAHVFRARLLQQKDPQSAGQALVRALELAPVLVLDLETDDTIATLLNREDVRDAIRRAHRQVG
jgi:hypothetical protein